MTEQQDQGDEVEDTVERVHGQLHRVRATYDESGKLVQQTLDPLQVEFRLQDVCQIVVGACVLAIPIAFTEEVWRLGEELPWANVIAIFVSSNIFVALFVYFIFYKEHLRGHTWQFLVRIIAGYVITLLVVAGILTMFQKCPWQTDLATAVKRVILVGFPASFSATVLDSLK